LAAERLSQNKNPTAVWQWGWKMVKTRQHPPAALHSSRAFSSSRMLEFPITAFKLACQRIQVNNNFPA
jgi:hypothetical protein